MMGNLGSFQKEKLILGSIINYDKEDINLIKSALEETFGPLDKVSEPFPFINNRSYSKEMGSTLNKYFFSFRNLIDPTALVDAKLKTTVLEKEFCSSKGDRFVNLDPGLLSLNKLIMATSKNSSQRIPLRNGVYGEVTLICTKTGWHALPWTSTDFQTMECQDFLTECRSLYWQQSQTGLSISQVPQ